MRRRGRLRIAEHGGGIGRGGRRAALGEERLGQGVDRVRAGRAASRRRRRGSGSPQKSASRAKPSSDGGDPVGLRVVEHLQAVFERAMRHVGLRQRGFGIRLDPAPGGERCERVEGAARAQVGVAAADDQLAGLGEELDLADAAAPELEVVAEHLDRPAEALVRADAQPHVVRVLDRGVVEVAAPDEGAQPLEERPAGVDRAGAGTGLDEGGALPGAADALVVALGRFGGDADRGDRRVGAQPQVGAEDVALGGVLGQQLDHRLGGADEAAAQVGVVGRVVAGLVEQHDEVDVGRVVELARAHLAHGEHEHAGAGRGVLGDAAGQLAAGDLGGERGGQRRAAPRGRRGRSARRSPRRAPRRRRGRPSAISSAARRLATRRPGPGSRLAGSPRGSRPSSLRAARRGPRAASPPRGRSARRDRASSPSAPASRARTASG